jgi:hypothetical protein
MNARMKAVRFSMVGPAKAGQFLDQTPALEHARVDGIGHRHPARRARGIDNPVDHLA